MQIQKGPRCCRHIVNVFVDFILSKIQIVLIVLLLLLFLLAHGFEKAESNIDIYKIPPKQNKQQQQKPGTA